MDYQLAKHPADFSHPGNSVSMDGGQLEQGSIDELNDDTFGDGAVVDDWETAHQQLSGLCQEASQKDVATRQSNDDQKQEFYQFNDNHSVDKEDTFNDGYSPFSPTIWSSSDCKMPSWNNDNSRDHENKVSLLSGDNIIKSISHRPPDWRDNIKRKVTVEELEKRMIQQQQHDRETTNDAGVANLNRLLRNAKILPKAQPSGVPLSTLSNHEVAVMSPPSFTKPQGFDPRNVARFERPNMRIPANIRPMYQPFPRDFRQPFRAPHPSMRPMPPMARSNFERYQIPRYHHHHYNNKMVNQDIRWRSPNVPFMMPTHHSGHLRQPFHPHVHPMRFNLIRPRSQTEDRVRASSAFDNIDLNGIGERLGILQQDESISSDSLMTKKEKEWLLKIQLLQLNNQDPYYDDYYFQMYELKKLAGRLGRPISNDCKSLLQLSNQSPDAISKQLSDNDVSNRELNVTANLVKPSTLDIKVKKHNPVSFQNTLGKLPVFSLTNPRKVIDAVQKTFDADEVKSSTPSREAFRKRRITLYALEKIYSLLLTLDDYDREILCTEDDTVKDEINEKKCNTINEMFEILKLKTTNGLPEKNNDDLFVQMLFIQKGKTLLSRMLRFLNQDQALAIVRCIAQNLSIIIKKDQIDKVLMVMKEAIQMVIVDISLTNVITCGQNLLQEPVSNQKRSVPSKVNPVVVAYKNEFGLMFLRSIVQRANNCISKNEGNKSLYSKWYEVVISICKNLKNIIANDAITDDRLALLNDLIIHCDQELCNEFISHVRSLEANREQ